MHDLSVKLKKSFHNIHKQLKKETICMNFEIADG